MSSSVPPDPNQPVAPKHIGILLFDDVEELDAVGPWEILANWALTYPQDGWTVSFVSKDGQPVRASKGLVPGAQHSFADVPPMRVFVHPGGQGTRTLMRDENHLSWVRAQRSTIPLMTSVCTGALVYAAAGLLDRRPATTHGESLELLQELDPSIDVDDTARFVDDGDVVTSAGVSAGRSALVVGPGYDAGDFSLSQDRAQVRARRDGEARRMQVLIPATGDRLMTW